MEGTNALHVFLCLPVGEAAEKVLGFVVEPCFTDLVGETSDGALGVAAFHRLDGVEARARGGDDVVAGRCDNGSDCFREFLTLGGNLLQSGECLVPFAVSGKFGGRGSGLVDGTQCVAAQSLAVGLAQRLASCLYLLHESLGAVAACDDVHAFESMGIDNAGVRDLAGVVVSACLGLAHGADLLSGQIGPVDHQVDWLA